ncbi:MAG: HK97 gp10 family phage protein [Candidatus Bathyarchaeota archaeon]|nr:HK97 gp10 family phage protein [Candidatus Bathyarchaeota archaeon]
MSVSIDVDVAGAEQFVAAMKRFDVEMQRKVQEQLEAWAEAVKSEAEREAPIRTGYLRSSITVESHNWQMKVGAYAAYAAAVEFGTRNHYPDPFLRPAIEEHKPRLEQVIREALNSAKMEAQL